jgi:hypothetical protein
MDFDNPIEGIDYIVTPNGMILWEPICPEGTERASVCDCHACKSYRIEARIRAKRAQRQPDRTTGR